MKIIWFLPQAENIVEDEEPHGFKLVFTFAENPFFSNKVGVPFQTLWGEDAEGTTH